MTLGLLVPPTREPYAEDLQKALDLGGEAYTIQDIEDMIATGKAQMWPGETSIIITEIINYPRAKHLHLFLAGGNLEELESMLPEIIEWGKTQNCDRVSLSGRRGWERSFLREMGFKPTLVIMEKEL